MQKKTPKKIKKEITFDGLAVKVDNLAGDLKGLTKTVESLVDTVDKLALITAKGFSDVDRRFEEIDNKLEKFKVETIDNFKSVRRDVLSANDRFVMQDTYYKKISVLESRIDNQDERITKIIDRVGKSIKP